MLEIKASSQQLLKVNHTHKGKSINANVIIPYVRALDSIIKVSKTSKKLIPTVFCQG